MPLLKHGEFLDDEWLVLEEDEALPEGADVIVGFDRLQREFESLKAHGGRLGVALPNDRLPDELVDYLGALHLIALTFPAFADGRAYSQGRQIRNHLEFAGELRATGHVLPDQLAMMRQCGFDAFVIPERHDRDVWQKAATSMTLSYQRSYVPSRGFAPAVIDHLRHSGSP